METHLSPKASGLDSFHENILKLYENKEIIAIKEAKKDQKKVEATMKWRENQMFKYAAKCKWYFPWTQSFFFMCFLAYHIMSS